MRPNRRHGDDGCRRGCGPRLCHHRREHENGAGHRVPERGNHPEGTALEIAGCLEDESWCDVIAGANRGWVFSEYLAFDRGGSYVLLPDIGLSALRIPAVRFVAADYWQRHYVGRPWYADRTRWIAFNPHPRAGWHRPPPGHRVAGWWRQGYAAPVGMRPPPEHGWVRHRDHDRH